MLPSLQREQNFPVIVNGTNARTQFHNRYRDSSESTHSLYSVNDAAEITLFAYIITYMICYQHNRVNIAYAALDNGSWATTAMHSALDNGYGSTTVVHSGQ